MYAVKGIEVSTKVVDIVEHKFTFHTSLFDKQTWGALEQIIEPTSWRLILLNSEGYVDYLTTNHIIKINSPLLRARSCPGETLVSITNNIQENIIYIYRSVFLCNRVVDNNFCLMHRESEYSRYLMFIYGLKEFPHGVGLALIPHMVYLLYAGGSNLKVGIANAIKNITRLYEQVFIYSSILVFVENAAIAREVERALSRSGIRDRMSVDERIDWIKKIEPAVFKEHLKSFTIMFSRHVKPLLKSIGISIRTTEILPVIRFCDRCFKEVKNSNIIYDRETLNNLNGVAEVEEYCLGGIILNLNNKKFFIPYQLIRDNFIAIDIIK